MARDTGFRLGLFADGAVGLEALNYVASQHPEQLALLVVRDKSFIEGLERGVDISGTPILLWDNLADERTLARIASLNLDVAVMAWWPFLLKKHVLDVLPPTVLNMHPSLLPYCRGKDPNFWALVEQSPFGVTLHHVTLGVDKGDIAFQSAIPYDWTDTGKSLYERAKVAMVSLFKESYPSIEKGEIPRIAQAQDKATFHRRAELEEASILDLDKNMRTGDLLNLLRARTFAPHPACKFRDAGKTYQVRVEIVSCDLTTDGTEPS